MTEKIKLDFDKKYAQLRVEEKKIKKKEGMQECNRSVKAKKKPEVK